jgi:hypothetical protein
MSVENWLRQLNFDPLPKLLSSGNRAIQYSTRLHFLGETDRIEALWQLPQVAEIIGRQREDGSWKYRAAQSHVRSRQDYDQLETFRILAQLIELYGLTRQHPSVGKAAGFLFARQTEEGDFRGIYQNQYTPNYSAAIMELLIKAGYEEDPRIVRGFTWLLSIRQDDGGWAIPLRTVSGKGYGTLMEALSNPRPIQPERPKPFSQLATGVVLRAFAAHHKYRESKEAKTAGELLKSRLFQPDKYPDRRNASYWTKFTFPFWFTDLLSALDSLSLLGFSQDGPRIAEALEWFRIRQQEDGLWKLSLLKNKSIPDLPLWTSLSVCKVFKRFYGT